MIARNSRIGFTIAFIASGIAHFASPRIFIALIPKVVPWRLFWVHISGVVELALAAGLWLDGWRRRAAQGTLALMLLFLPLHAADVFREKPVAGGRKGTAVLRLIAQFGLIALAQKMTQAESGAAP